MLSFLTSGYFDLQPFCVTIGNNNPDNGSQLW